MENRLELQQKQAISQNMISALNILQLNSVELKEYVEAAALENPLIDLDALHKQTFPEESPSFYGSSSGSDDRSLKAQWLANLDEQNRTYYRYEYDKETYPDLMDTIPDRNGETLADHILLQILLQPDFDYDRDVIDYLCSCLDSRGFFTETEEDTARILHIPKDEVHRYLSFLKTLEPAGVFSSCVQECLLCQLSREALSGQTEKNGFEVERMIISSCLDLLAKRQIDTIAKKLHIKKKQVLLAEQHIKMLNPVPSRGFAGSDPVRYTTPDVIVVRFPERFEILINDYTCPSISLNPEYLQMLKSDCPSDALSYLQEKKQQALSLQEQIQKRNHTLLRLAEFIVENQSGFFLYGSNSLRPCSRSQAAKALSLHESTISRALKGKYLQCSYGDFPLEYFFSRSLPSDAESSGSVSVTEICNKISSFIRAEDREHPLKDEDLCLLLNKEGIHISRRTIAKYRDRMNIPVWRLRR